MTAGAFTYEQLLQLTPNQVWFFFEALEEDRSELRANALIDFKAVVNSALSKDGHKDFEALHQQLLRWAGLTPSPYTGEAPSDSDS